MPRERSKNNIIVVLLLLAQPQLFTDIQSESSITVCKSLMDFSSVHLSPPSLCPCQV